MPGVSPQTEFGPESHLSLVSQEIEDVDLYEARVFVQTRTASRATANAGPSSSMPHVGDSSRAKGPAGQPKREIFRWACDVVSAESEPTRISKRAFILATGNSRQQSMSIESIRLVGEIPAFVESGGRFKLRLVNVSAFYEWRAACKRCHLSQLLPRLLK